MKAKHPPQPIVKDKDGTERFKANAIVRYLLDAGKIDMNQILPSYLSAMKTAVNSLS